MSAPTMKPSGYVVRHEHGGAYLGRYSITEAAGKFLSFVPWAFAYLYETSDKADEARRHCDVPLTASRAEVVPVYPTGAFGAPQEPAK